MPCFPWSRRQNLVEATKGVDLIERRTTTDYGERNSFIDAFQASDTIQTLTKRTVVPQVHQIGRSEFFSFLTNDFFDPKEYFRMENHDCMLRKNLIALGNDSISFQDNKKTLFLSYAYIYKEEELFIDRKMAKSLARSYRNCTHVVTKKIYGFEILLAIRNITNRDAYGIEQLFMKIFGRLSTDPSTFALTEDEKSALDRCQNISIYHTTQAEGIKDLSFSQLFEKLGEWQGDQQYHRPIIHILHSLNYLEKSRFAALRPIPFPLVDNRFQRISKKIENIDWIFEMTYDTLNHISANSTDDPLKKQKDRLREKYDRHCQIYQTYRHRLHDVLVGADQRSFESIRSSLHTIQSLLTLFEVQMMNYWSLDLQRCLDKVQLIERLSLDYILYFDVTELNAYPNCTLEDLEMKRLLTEKFSNLEKEVILWYSSDRLRRERGDDWEHSYQSLKEERSNRRQVIYIDFTWYRLLLQESKTISLPRSRSLQPVEINVLLLGETGVGKSTFINAFVNYLAYNTLQEAEKNNIIHVIPASFLITVSDDFQEVIVNIGDPDPNEDYSLQGASVTQHCKSYIIPLSSDLHLRLIDTPGMGDTRGIDQDMKNIDHILSYVNTLSHLNAVCFLLKPNQSRMDIFFRLCLQQLLNYLTPDAHENINFCFTNSRSTFYAPGNTGQLLRKQLDQQTMTSITFQKSNTFCFDSESFRYLAMFKQGILLDNLEKQEYIQSWNRSVEAAVNLFKFIQSRHPYDLSQWKSPAKLSLQIRMIARPLMETWRLMIYNILLRQHGNEDHRITLDVDKMEKILCSHCIDEKIVDVGPFRIVQYGTKQKKDGLHCQCDEDRARFLIEYRVQHRYSHMPASGQLEELIREMNDHRVKCQQLDEFMKMQRGTLWSDPFQLLMEQFLREEMEIVQQTSSMTGLNTEIPAMLKQMNTFSGSGTGQTTDSDRTLKLGDVQNIINEMMSKPDVKKQMDALRKSRQEIHESRQCQVVIDANNDAFRKLLHQSEV